MIGQTEELLLVLIISSEEKKSRLSRWNGREDRVDVFDSDY